MGSGFCRLGLRVLGLSLGKLEAEDPNQKPGLELRVKGLGFRV